MTQNTALVQDINNAMAITLPEKISFETLHNELAAHINHLIEHNFEHLITLLYKIDINEDKLKFFLNNNNIENAGNTIATLIIERLQQKVAFKKQFANKSSASSNEEKW